MKQHHNNNIAIQLRKKRMALMRQMDTGKTPALTGHETETEKTNNNLPEAFFENSPTTYTAETRTTNTPLIIQRATDAGKDEDDDDGSGKKRKLKPGNIIKNITRTIGRGVRSIGRQPGPSSDDE